MEMTQNNVFSSLLVALIRAGFSLADIQSDVLLRLPL